MSEGGGKSERPRTETPALGAQSWSNLQGDAAARQRRFIAETRAARLKEYSAYRNREYDELAALAQEDLSTLEVLPPDVAARIKTRLELSEEGLTLTVSGRHLKKLGRWLKKKLSSPGLKYAGASLLGAVGAHWLEHLEHWIKQVLHVQ